MPEKQRNYFSVISYMVPLVADSAADLKEIDVSDMHVPDGALVIGEVIEDIDFTATEDWERLGFNMMIAFERRIRQSGWPKSGEVDMPLPPSSPAAEQEADSPSPPVATNEEAPDPDTVCKSCGQVLIVTGSRSFCPQGCSEIGSAEAAPRITVIKSDSDESLSTITNETGRPGSPYIPTKEGGPPSSFPQGDVIPSSD
jgi:hypothetical protein